LVHQGHPGAVVLARETCHVHLQGNRAHRRLEVVQPHLGTQPVCQVSCVCEGCRQADDAHFAVRVGADVVGARHYDL
ncbi:unnamed protein product, partial [Ixodes persulcatus]